ncbi:hypothetical protein PV387_08615 [Streptomyces sp. ME02-6987-2C]|uniref:hypothetical protein n=1 Tax=unclassified Streptomyces TaxID=2593676 RepID=UPI0029B02C5B|nr:MULTISPECIES: hypothetical protein [unclassified Streptomyces]MDX3366091.1 hypothetical protein [Streptomyces sp. ME02-6987-2C]MDX3426404.1 hypothetical protein [Streptomyces sp. ME02-6985-2c]
MLGRRSRGKQQNFPDHTNTTMQPSLLCEVLILGDGSAVIDGVGFPVPDGEPVHVAVLDAMHRQAQARGEPVQATIHDRQERYTTHVEVAPDGSSRVLRHEGEEQEPDLGLAASGPGLEPLHVGPQSPPPVTPSSASGATDASPAPEALPSTASPTEMDTPAPAVPEQFGDLVGQITSALDTGNLESAMALAFRLSKITERTFGAGHPQTLEAHALEAFVAHRSGNHRFAATKSLELARFRGDMGDGRAHEELRRAVAAWQLADDMPWAVDFGRSLLTVWSVLAERGESSAQDAVLLRGVNRRIYTLAAAAAAHRTGAA